MPIELPDINILIALVDENHVRHGDAEAWFAGVGQTGWATCPFTENGFARIVSNSAYAALPYTVSQAVTALDKTIQRHRAKHEFWPDEVSLLDADLFNRAAIQGPKQIADVYLLGLCQQRGGTFVTLDQRLSVAAISAPHARLIRVL